MSAIKRNMTRPEFCKRILTGCDDQHDITEDDLRRMAESGYVLPYCAYTVMMGVDLSASDILNIHDDSETIAIKLSSKSLAKEIKARFNKDHVKLGYTEYIIRVKADGSYIFIDAIECSCNQ